MKAVVTVKKESSGVKRKVIPSAEETTAKKSIGKSSKKGKSDDNQSDNQSDDDFASPVNKGKKPRAT